MNFTNETFGISAEIALCNVFKCENNIDEKRGNPEIIKKLQELFSKNKDKLGFNKIEYTGEKGNPVDFIDTETGKTISLKTNLKKSERICPQKIGQCTKDKFKENVWSKILGLDDPFNQIDDNKIKEFILKSPKSLIPLYFDNLFCCDILVYIKETNDTYEIKIIKQADLKISITKKILEKEIFEFSKNSIEKNNKAEYWNESNTLYIKYKKEDKEKKEDKGKKEEINYERLSLGEFQIHKNRNCIKFRFNFKNLLNYLQQKNLLTTI